MLSNCEFTVLNCIRSKDRIIVPERFSEVFKTLNFFFLSKSDNMASLGIRVESKKQVSAAFCTVVFAADAVWEPMLSSALLPCRPGSHCVFMYGRGVTRGEQGGDDGLTALKAQWSARTSKCHLFFAGGWLLPKPRQGRKLSHSWNSSSPTFPRIGSLSRASQDSFIVPDFRRRGWCLHSSLRRLRSCRC